MCIYLRLWSFDLELVINRNFLGDWWEIVNLVYIWFLGVNMWFIFVKFIYIKEFKMILG